MSKKYTVYRHKTPSGKMYVGITSKNPKYRWNNGRGYINNKYFSKAIQKYGWDNIEHELLLQGLSKEQAECAERIFIGYWNLTDANFGYNFESGGAKNFRVSQETRRKLSLACRGKKNGMYGKKHSDESKRKMSISSKERYKKERNPMYGKHHTLDSRSKMSKSHKGKKLSDEHKKHLGEARKRRPVCMMDATSEEILNNFHSIKEASETTRIRYSSIVNCCRNRYVTAGGYKWKYINNC